ncbi:MAG TPA: dihydrodipicolinate reductase C-terminal domain-containing protein [Vicinamibacterales bacterium]|nr:dihydrodipicolinate reductase C-terminal domain-containing protein [Vicinamibacterales bacterium]
MRVLLVGHGRMGKLVEALAPEYQASIARVITREDADSSLRAELNDVDIAIDFTVADAVPRNLPLLAERGVNVVIGTSGWTAHEPELRRVVERSNIGVLAAPNFSLGLNVFQLIVEEAARRFAPHEGFGAWIHELHHATKKDAPSGTALQLHNAMEQAGYRRRIDVASTRAGSIPGIHTVGFDGPADTVTLTHSVRDRAVFARGALEAARWLQGKRGWFTMRDFLTKRV